ncbi:MAG TPA: HD domain-containing protein, partial [Symbiobacteriaceae bacterium]|nr:HD domain-containing protein [Symbiobacteriaceae bacterium]
MKEYIFRDPVHGNVAVTDETVMGLIQSPEFQRLRRVRQLGTSFISYPGAEHTRFAHSLGVYHLMVLVLKYLNDHQIVEVTQEQMTLGACAALLHDVGHGPFSHLFEKLTGLHHERWTERIITAPETEVNRVLTARDPALPGQIAAMIRGDYQGAPFLKELLSSQMDVDRMDYLLRDSRMCGVTYGQFDLDRLVQTLTVTDGHIALSPKGLTSVEEFILARYFMYWNVYFHKATRSIELVLERMIRRAMELLQEGYPLPVPAALVPVLTKQELSLEQYLELDETDVLYAIKSWRQVQDPILRDLADRFINRRLFTGLRIEGAPTPEQQAAVAALLTDRGFDPAYYMGIDKTGSVAYKYYVPSNDVGGPRPIYVQADWKPGAP